MILSLLRRLVKFNSIPVFKNIAWLFFDKLFRMGIGLVVATWLARYLGTQQYGVFNYLTAIVSIMTIVSLLGLDSIVVKELVDNPRKSKFILSTVFLLRLFSGIFSFLICVIIINFFKGNEPDVLKVGIILSTVLIFQSLSTSIDLYYQSKVLSKFTVYAQNLSFILSSVIKVYLILENANLIAFAIVTSLEIFLNSLFLGFAYLKISKETFALKVRMQFVVSFIKKGWPLMFSGLLIMIYMRIDQIMIGEMVNSAAVGTYSAALKLSEIWYFLPVIICNSFFPSIIEAKKESEQVYINKIQRLLDQLVMISLAVSVVVSVFAGNIIAILYGSEYSQAAIILSIHIWTSVFVFLGVASSNYFVLENLQKKMLLRAALGVVVNIGLNLVFIPLYGPIGAAISTLISQCCGSYLFDLLSKQTTAMFIMKTKSIIGFNYWVKLLNVNH